MTSMFLLYIFIQIFVVSAVLFYVMSKFFKETILRLDYILNKLYEDEIEYEECGNNCHCGKANNENM